MQKDFFNSSLPFPETKDEFDILYVELQDTLDSV